MAIFCRCLGHLLPPLICFYFGFALVRWSWNVLVRRAKRRRPARAQIVEIGLAGLDAVIEVGLAGIRAHHQHVDRQADAEVGAHGRIHRDQAGLQRFIEFDVVMHGAVEHRLAVFVLADLQIGRIGGAFDEIAGGVDHEQPHPRALDLAAEQERDVEGDIFRLQGVAFGGVHGADGAADALGSLKHGRRVHQGFDLAGVGIFQTLGQGREHRLADREIAGAGDRHDPLAGLAEDVELAESRNVVEAGIGARVRDHDQAVPHQNSAAISHSQSPNAPKFVGAKLVANFTGASNPNSPATGCAEWAETAIERRAGGGAELPELRASGLIAPCQQVAPRWAGHSSAGRTPLDQGLRGLTNPVGQFVGHRPGTPRQRVRQVR